MRIDKWNAIQNGKPNRPHGGNAVEDDTFYFTRWNEMVLSILFHSIFQHLHFIKHFNKTFQLVSERYRFAMRSVTLGTWYPVGIWTFRFVVRSTIIIIVFFAKTKNLCDVHGKTVTHHFFFGCFRSCFMHTMVSFVKCEIFTNPLNRWKSIYILTDFYFLQNSN